MAKEAAFKLLAKQEDISNKRAKSLIDRGIVYVSDRKVMIARAPMDVNTKFRIEYPSKPSVIFEDDNLIAVNKPPHLESDEVLYFFEGTTLLHRLDRETSGVLVLCKDEAFCKEAIREFKRQRVYKEYIAWVEGVVAEPLVIDDPILTIKKNKAFSKIDPVRGKSAHTVVEPLEVHGKKTKVCIVIKTGRTHQIRAHLSAYWHPIVGDSFYGSVTKSKRILLHAHKLKLFEYEFVAPEPQDIVKYK